MTTRNYSSVTPLTTLSSGITPSDTTVTVASAGPWPAPPFTLILGYDTVDEEVVEVTAASGGGNVFTVTRGVDGTTAKSHSAGSQAVHGVSAREFSEANAHVNATTSVHGIADTAALETTTGAQAKADAAEAAAAAYTDSSVAGIDLSGYVANALVNAKGDIVTATADDTPARLAVGANGTVLTADSSTGTGLAWKAAAPSSAPSLLSKADPWSVCLVKTGVGTASIKAGTSVLVDTTLVTFSSDTSITMPTLTLGTDYFVYVSSAGSAQAVAATGSWPTPVASSPANSQLIGGFHYAPGSNATGTSGGNSTPEINAYSMWDLKWRPTAPDPRGMTLVADTFWMDIYFLNEDPSTNGTSAWKKRSASAGYRPIIPAKFGGNGTTRYASMSWWNAAECLAAFGKRFPTVSEAAAAFYGSTPYAAADAIATWTSGGVSDSFPFSWFSKFTSRWGVICATGNSRIWGADFGGGTAAASYAAVTDSRGNVYQQENAVTLGGTANIPTESGPRGANWSLSPSATSVQARGCCNHVMHF